MTAMRATGWVIAGALLLVLLGSAGCSAGLAYLIYEELKEDEPLVSWEGTVKDSAGSAIRDVVVMVQYKLESEADSVERTYQDTTDEEGEFTVDFRWHEHATYSVLLIYGEQSYRPPEYQEQYVAKQKDRDLQFVFDVLEPEEECSWYGIVEDQHGDRANGALVRIDLTGVDDQRTFWGETHDGGVYSIGFAWNKAATYTVSVYYGQRLVEVKDCSDPNEPPEPEAGEDDPTKDESGTDQEFSKKLEAGKVVVNDLRRGDRNFNLEIADLDDEVTVDELLTGSVEYTAAAGASVQSPARDTLVLLKCKTTATTVNGNGSEGSSISAERASQATSDDQYFWAITDRNGSYELEYGGEVETYTIELVYNDHCFLPQGWQAATEAPDPTLDFVISVEQEHAEAFE